MAFCEGVSALQQWLLEKVYNGVGGPQVRLALKSGAEVSSTSAPVADIIIDDLKTLLQLIIDPEIGFGDAYREGRITVNGDLVTALNEVFGAMSRVDRRYTLIPKVISKCLEYVQRNSRSGSRKNIHHHYDLNTNFYRLWLDRNLVYTCAYFPTPDATLEQAQTAKLDYVCRKLQLQPGERIVEAGCGWGALALHMAGQYGVSVRAFNISHEQILEARKRAQELGLAQKVEFVEDDYRNITGKYDAFVSVGMLEHVGKEHYSELGQVIHRTLHETGRGFLHFIGRNRPRAFSRWTRKRIFPGAYAPALSQVMQMLEPWDFSVLDIENLRLHYAKTLEHWLARFEKSKLRVVDMFGPEFVRAWRLYLAGSISAFRVGSLQLFQVLFARTACRQIPLTRAHLYQEPKQEEMKWMHATS